MSSGPTQDKAPIQTCHDMKAKEGTAVLLNTAGLLHQIDRCWGSPTQLWMVFLGDGAMQHRSREGGFGEMFIFLAKHFMSPHFGRKFLPSKLGLIQIKSDKKPIPPCPLWLRLWFENGDSTSLFSLTGVTHDGSPVSEHSAAT